MLRLKLIIANLMIWVPTLGWLVYFGITYWPFVAEFVGYLLSAVVVSWGIAMRAEIKQINKLLK
ncbi:hypothetical protein GCM10027578_22020 [Spirosoma luteolum]